MGSRYLKAEEKAGKNSEAMPKSLLLVEDEDKHAALIRKAFRESKSEWKIYRVATLKAALEWLREVETKPPFVVVADYRLPDDTGLDLAGEAKSPEELGFPIIILTGQGSEQLAVRSFKSGAMDYMVKRTEWLQELPWTVERVLRELDTITERKHAEEWIRNAEQDWRNSFNSLDDVMLIIDKDYNIEKINDKGLKLLGKSKEEVIGQKCYQVISGADSPSDDYPCMNSRETKKVESFDLYEKRSGKYFSVTNSPVFDEQGEIIKFVDLWRDISERKRMEMEREQFVKELEAKNAELERFTYTVSHDLKAPLLTIQGFATLLQDDLKQNESEKVESYLKYIAGGAKKMEHLLDDLLQLSRIGRMVNPPEDVPFGEIVREAQIAVQLKTSGLEIVVADDLPAVHVDHLRIAEMLVNLISNSINYMGAQPHPKIEIGYRVDGEETVFFVRDNGIGIEESEHEKVFELFYRVDNRSNKGTGAGLAIVKRIVEVHGGHIWIESEAGIGCTVCFTLPFCS